MLISIIGYMGVGKTTISNYLSSLISYEWVDLDQYISLKENLSINEIFEKKGELYFRKLENKYLKELLTKNNLIISTGGGTPVYFNNIELINQKSESIYLHLPIPLLAERLFPQKNHRPMIARFTEKKQLEEYISKHLLERNHFYNKAKYKIDTSNKDIEEISNEIIKKLNLKKK